MDKPHERFKPRSRVDIEMTPEHKREFYDLLSDSRVTYDELTDWCRDKGYDFSRASVARYGKNFYEFRQKTKERIDQAKMLKTESGDALILSEVLVNLIQQQLFDKLMSGEFDIDECKSLLGGLAKIHDAETKRAKLQADFDEKKRRAADTVETIAKKGGLSEDTVTAIRQQIMGIAA